MHTQAPPIQKLAVGVVEAAKIAGIGRTTLYSAISNGALKSFTIGSRRLIRVSELERWTASHEETD